MLLVFLLLGSITSTLAQNNFFFPNQFQFNATTPFTLPEGDDTCQIRKGWTGQEKCEYVKANSDNCEGGGYLMWSRYVTCTQNVAGKVFIIIGGILVLFVCFLHISTSADEFFSPNIAAIVAHLKISESIAGVTFMAFGNGAPDIFGSIASILSTPKPKADLALGALLGAGLFCTTCVLGAIVFTAGPFKIHKFGVIRDLFTYLIAVGWILYVFLAGNTVDLFEPLIYLGIYILYVAIVIGGTILLNKIKARKIQRRITDGSYKIRSRRSTHVSSRTDSIHSRRRSRIQSRRQSRISRALSVVSGEGMEFPKEIFILGDDLEKHKIELKYIDYTPEKAENTESEMVDDDEDAEEDEEYQDVVVLHNHVYDREDAPLGEEDQLPPTFSKAWKWSDIPKDIAIHLNPWPSTEEWNESGKIAKVMYFIRVPSQIILRATIPRYEDGWSKPVALLYCLVAPQFILFAIHMLTTSPFKGSPGLFVYGFGVSAILILLVLLFTRMDTPPRYHKEVACYTGFLLAVAWIYFTASEIISIITMIGVISGLSFQFLGLTILAWSNTFGDFMADLAVVKQGFPRMAMAAATGGPLFNLLMGFGLSFTIAKAKGTIIEIEFSPALHFTVIFLFLSLSTSLVAIFIQRFRSTRYHAFALWIIYACFFVLAILCEAKVIRW